MTFPLSMTFPFPRPASAEPISTEPGTIDDGYMDSFQVGKHRHHPSVSVVIPALNEAENLPHVLPRIPAWVDEVLLVDGNSSDGTPEVARRVLDRVRIVQQKGPGKGAALQTGFAVATGDIIVAMDADCSTNPAEIPLFCAALLSGADYVKGSRFLQGAGSDDMEFVRLFGNWAFAIGVRVLFRANYTDVTYGYNAFWRRVLPRLELDGDGFEIETLMCLRALRAGLRVVEIPSFEVRRKYGSSRLHALPDGWRVLKTILKERIMRRSSRPQAGFVTP